MSSWRGRDPNIDLPFPPAGKISKLHSSEGLKLYLFVGDGSPITRKV
jgi:hypothetical protein